MFIPGNKGQATVIVNSNTGEIEIEEPDYSQTYLTFEAIESGKFKFSTMNMPQTLSYSLDDGDRWTSLADNTYTPIINAGNKIMWKGNFKPSSGNGPGNFSATGKFNVYGNVMSLLYGDNFIGQMDLIDSAVMGLFFNDINLINAQDLILSATTLASSCYAAMFQGCTSLTTAPELPATVLVEHCYQQMFDGCTNLKYIKMLATDISAYLALYNWVRDVSSTGTFVKAAGVTIPTGSEGIPKGWTVVEA